MRQYKNQYGTIFAVRQKAGEPRLMCRVEEGRSWVISVVLAPRTGDAKTEQELQAVLDRTAEELGWTECKDTDAPTGAAAVTTGGNAASAESTAETLTTSESGEDANNSPGLPSAPADTSPQPPKAADAVPATRTTASSASGNGSLPAFDYSGLDDQTVQDLHLAAREVACGKRMAEIGLRRMADGVAIAHEALCGSCDIMSQLKRGACDIMSQAHNNQHSENTFGAWCESVGLNRKAAERLLQVSKLFDQSSPRQQKALEELGPTLLYAAAKPSAPAKLVQAVKDGDITTHKQYQDLLARYNAEKAAREQAEQERDEAATHIQAARDMQIDTARERDAALQRATEAEKQRDGARDALAAAKLRGDKLKAENDALKAHPIEAQVVDEDEIDRRAQARADELTAPLREELEALRARHPADLEEAEQAIRDAYDSAIYTSRTIENAWHSLRPLLSCMDSERRVMAVRQLEKILTKTQEELRKCL